MAHQRLDAKDSTHMHTPTHAQLRSSPQSLCAVMHAWNSRNYLDQSRRGVLRVVAGLADIVADGKPHRCNLQVWVLMGGLERDKGWATAAPGRTGAPG